MIAAMLFIVAVLSVLMFLSHKEIVHLDLLVIRVVGLLVVAGVVFYMMYQIGKQFYVF